MINLQDFYSEIEYGMFDDVDGYGAIRALNSSSLKLGDKTPLHIDAALNGKLRYTKKEFDFGTEFHLMLFEPELFKKVYYISDKHLGKKTNVDKAALIRELPFNGGKTRIDLREGEIMKRMVDSLHSHKGIRELIETKGVIEQTLIWKDSEFDVNCKGRLDKLIQGDFIIDLKSTKDACETYFSKDFKKFGYGLQSAFYSDGYKTLFPEHSATEFMFIVVDKQEPYRCELYGVSEKTMSKGRDEYKKHIRDYIDYKHNPESINTVKML